ncbi:hypothetical protein DXG03_006658 [Asterophora parasitica]|uniref:DAGKc domain-containing protein n=1 Tax=Asterophora parasitica TaxID=117018 RepID=A0A9P7KEU6_9AGAR|nr:hypothetical protein DXG03_006658 [Asterophora parasitica]
MTQQDITIREIYSGKLITFKREAAVLRITFAGTIHSCALVQVLLNDESIYAETKAPIDVPHRQVLGVSFDEDNGVLHVAYLYRKKRADALSLVKLEGKPQGPQKVELTEWAETLVKNAYDDLSVPRRRRLKVLVNPHGGVRKAVSVFVKIVEPIFRAAQCSLDVIHTTHNGHAYEIAKDLTFDYDVVVTVSGDGIVHEIMNGFAHHENPRKAFSIPIAPIPTGSGNGLSLNLLGLEDDKVKMANKLEARRDLLDPLEESTDVSGPLPPLTNLPDDTDGWTTYDEPILYIYAGKGPFVGRDFMAFPVSLPDDGVIDIAVQPVSSRKEILSAIGGAAKGQNYWHPDLHYVKAHAYRVKPLSQKGTLLFESPGQGYQHSVGTVVNMPKLSQYEIEREANIARNRALLEELELKQAVAGLGITPKPAAQTKAKPVQPRKRVKKDVSEAEAPRRQSSRLKRSAPIDLDESPAKRQKREAELEELRAKEAEERLEAEERARIANRPRKHDLDLPTLVGADEADEVSTLFTTLKKVAEAAYSKRVGDPEAFAHDSDKQDKAEVSELRERLESLKIVSRAKVTQDRVYSAAYHPEVTKDLIFFGGAMANLAYGTPEHLLTKWQMRMGKLRPILTEKGGNTGVYKPTGPRRQNRISREVYSTDDGVLISTIDLTPTGNEMWISDSAGGATHLDLRESTSKTRWYGLSDQKIGCISVNPSRPHFILTASNNRSLK